MKKSDQPLAIIGFLFALSIGFWGGDMVTYFQEGPPARYRITEGGLTQIAGDILIKGTPPDGVATKLEENLEGLKDKSIETERWLKGVLSDDEFKKHKKQILAPADVASKLMKMNSRLRDSNNARFETVTEEGLKKWLLSSLEQKEFKDYKEEILRHADALKAPGGLVWGLTLLAGLVFLADIVCIMWWYAKYIHRIQTTATLGTYFLDFGVCAMFNVAATSWTTPEVFLIASLIASGLLIWRFVNLYRSPEASDTDKRVLKASRNWFGVAVVICLACLGFVVIVALPFLIEREPTILQKVGMLFTQGPLYPVLVGVLSGIGVGLTVKFREKIRVSAEMHEEYGRRFKPMELHWPKGLSGESEARRRITESTRKGLERYRALFKGGPNKLDHDRVRSRVHPEGDLRVQSYILATPSWTRNGRKLVLDHEVEKKAFMVGVSHWLDDLVDGRSEAGVYQKLKSEEAFGLTLRDSEQVFERIYKDIVVNYTNDEFYAKLFQGIEKCAQLPENRQYLFFSLNRVAVGAAVFGPKVKDVDRMKLLETHNSMLAEMIREEDPGGKDRWHEGLLKLLTDMRADPSGLGKILLGLTTKTVQEMAMASEGQRVCFALSVLYSLLYAPLLYFHDVDGELECSEIVPLETFDVSYDGIVPWLEKMAGLIKRKDAPRDPRRESRLKQLDMAFRCFKPNLPQVAIRALEEIYEEKRHRNAQRGAERRGARAWPDRRAARLGRTKAARS